MPNIDEARFDLAARQEALAKIRGLPEQHFREVIQVQKAEAKKATERQRKGWEEAWRLYQSEADFSEKEEWQSQVWIPMPFSATEQATAIIQRSMIDSPDFFGVEGHDERDKKVADLLVKPLIKLAFEKCRFTHKFTDAVKVAFATGISAYLKFRFRTFQVPSVGGVQLDPMNGQPMPVYTLTPRQFLSIDIVPPWQVYRDPQSRPREQWSGSYLMYEDWVDRAYLLQGQRAGIYKNVDKLAGTTSSAASLNNGPSQAARRKGQTWEPNKFRKPSLATEWYGDVPDQNGDLVYPDATMILADEQLLYGPADNPLWAVDTNTGRRKWPLVGFTAIQHPLRFEGYGILAQVTPLATLFSNIFNLFADGLNWSVNPPTEVNLTALQDWDDTEHFPGKLWYTNQDAQALRPAQFGKMDASTVLAALQYVHTMFENESFVTAFVAGLPGARSNITAKETQLKTSQSMGIFEGMAKNLEAGGVACVELAYDFISQYLTTFQDPAIVELIGPMAAQILGTMDPASRMEQLRGNFNYVFTGVTQALQKADLLGRLMQAATLAASGPYMGLTNPVEILQAIFDAMGVRDKITITPVPMLPMPMVQQAVAEARAEGAAEAQAMAGGGGGRPGGGGPPRPNAGPKRVPPPSLKQLNPAPNEMSTAAAT